MRIIKTEKAKISYDQLGESLGVNVEGVYRGESNDSLKILTSDGLSIYLRCSDIKKICNLNFNLLDEQSLKIDHKGKVISYHAEVELWKGSSSKERTWRKVIQNTR